MRGYVDLVECKECKYKEMCGAKVLIREANRFNLKEITYCSYGERKEE